MLLLEHVLKVDVRELRVVSYRVELVFHLLNVVAQLPLGKLRSHGIDPIPNHFGDERRAVIIANMTGQAS